MNGFPQAIWGGTGTGSFAGLIPIPLTVPWPTLSDQSWCAYVASDAAGNLEIGAGLYTLSTTTLTRAFIFSSTNAGSLVNFPGSAIVQLSMVVPPSSGGGSGTVTSVATDATLTGGPITGTGTLGINLANANTWMAAITIAVTGTSVLLVEDTGGTNYPNLVCIDTTNGAVNFGDATSAGVFFNVAGYQPAAVGSGNGTAGGAIQMISARGGNTSTSSGIQHGGAGGTFAFAGGVGGTSTAATTSKSGAGGLLSFQGGAGAAASAGTTGNVGGAGGELNEQSGAGGAASGGSGTASGGGGGLVERTAGNGGAASGASTANNGGTGGSIQDNVGIGGTGATANGANGGYVLNINGSNQSPTAGQANWYSGGTLMIAITGGFVTTLAYSPANSSYWASTAPSNLVAAVDRIAAWIHANATVFTTLGITTQP